jgi:hypothetical protein
VGFGFRKSFKILPGVRVNVSKSGVSTSVGAGGFTQNFSKKGRRTTVNLPGMGLNYTTHAKRQSNNGQNAAGSNFRLVALVIAVLVVVVAYLMR